MSCLYRFHSIRPPYETKQEDTFDWLIAAHCESEKTKGNQELETFRKEIAETFIRVGAKSDHIAKRGHILPDVLHRDWQNMQIYRLGERPTGVPLAVRLQYFDAFVTSIFERYYPDRENPPDDLIHVSCTGYLSPSGAQKIVSKRGWGQATAVTHAYHMGCYGAFPAIRMGMGFLASGKRNVDIVHTEVCSIHSNPSLHAPDQIVSQTLFADGFIKYSIAQKTNSPHLKILAVHEEIIPDSIESMTWNVVDWGNQISLSKEVPVRIARALDRYLKALCEKGGFAESLSGKALFAIHPGGPKILKQIQERLDLTDQQMAHSIAVLKECGNMSSATLPHIWEAILADPTVPDGAPLISLAFGPGLSISGSIMVKACGSSL